MRKIRVHISSTEDHVLVGLKAEGIMEAAQMLRALPPDAVLVCEGGVRVVNKDARGVSLVLS